MFRSPHKPTSPPPPPPMPGKHRAGINVDPDGKRSRLPGDTVRQVVTPGRIKNLASLFDQQTKKPSEVTPSRRPRSSRRVTTDEFFTPTALPQEMNNNSKKGPPRKPIRSFAAQLILEEEDIVTEEDFEAKNERTFSVSTERSINDEEFVAIAEGIVDEEVEKVAEEIIISTEEDAAELEKKLREEIRIEEKKEQLQMEELREKIQLENDISTTKDEDFVTAEDAVPATTGETDNVPKVSMRDADPIPRITAARRTRALSRVDEYLDEQRLLVLPIPRSRTVSQGDDQQSVNGHIDNLFDFVDEHLSSKQSQNSRDCVFQPHFSPSTIPNVAELSQDLTIGPQVKSNNSSKRVGSALATSTPQNSPRSTVQHPSRLLEGDVSFVSSIQDVSQTEAVGQYEQMIMKNDHALDRNNQQITMLLKALAHARKERKPMQEVSVQKSLLMARERVVLLQRENKRLKALVACRRPIPNQCLEVRGSLTISNVAVHLNRNFYTKPYEMATNFSFLVMLKCGCEVECTATHNLLAHQSSRLKVVHFDEKINFCNLPVDFCVMLEVYAMAIPEKEAGVTCASIIASKCRNLLPKERTPTASPSGFPYGEFVRCGYVQLTRDTTGTNKFYLDEVEYPLDGTIEITTHCTTLPPAIAIDHEGFLTMYQCISGMSSWERYWAVLRRGTVLFWKYPEDERLNKAAKARLDLSTCSQFEVGPCSFDQCPRPHAFAVNVLVNTAPSVMDKKRIFLAADSRCEMKNWLDNINETLSVLRGSHPYKGSILPRN